MSKVKDTIYGFIVGEAMGVPIEFRSRESLKEEPITTMIGYGTYFYIPEGVWSDDGALTLATMDSIASCGKIDCTDMATRFCEWVKHGKYTATNEVFDIGITTKYALRRFMDEHVEAIKCGGVGIGENGNGSLMRMAPIALYCYYAKKNDEEILDIVKNTSSITHAHEQSIMGCYMYVKYLLFLLQGENKIDAYEHMRQLDYSMFSQETQDVYYRILMEDISKYKEDDIKSNGYIVYTLEAVLWTILRTRTYQEAIVVSINLGEDTDTVGAITGSLAGIIYGYSTIDDEWIKALKNKELLDSIILEFENKISK